MTTANKITVTRILMIPIFVMMAIYYAKGVRDHDPQPWQQYCAITVFLLASASDGLDGYIARHYNQRSQLGLILDPIADKGLLLAGIITLSVCSWGYEFPAWFPVLVITRDAVILTGTLVLHYLTGKVRVRPSWLGKTATAVQMIAIACVLLQLNPFHRVVRFAGLTLQYDFLDIPVALAGIFTFVSGVGYVLDGIAQLHAAGHGDAKP